VLLKITMAGYDAVVIDLETNGLLSHFSIVQFFGIVFAGGENQEGG